MKRVLSLILVLAMLIPTFGCNAEPDESSSSSKSVSSGATSSESEAELPAEPVTLTIFMSGDSERINENNPMHAFIREKAGVELEYEIPVGDEAEKLNMLLVGGTYPDLIVSNNAEIKNTMVEEGIALAIDHLIDEHAPNLRAAYGEKFDTLYHEDGHIYNVGGGYQPIETNEDIIPASWSGWTFNIREDIWQALGSPEIKDLDDVYDALVKMKDIEATNALGTDYYPLGGFVQGWQNMLETLIMSAGGYEGRYYVDDNDQLSYWVRAPWAVEIIKWYNKVNREGLLDPESFTMDRSTFCTQKIGGDQVKSYFGIHYYVNSQVPNLEALGIENGYWQNFPVSVPEVGQRPNLLSVSTLMSPNFFVTDNLKDDETKQLAAMRLINTMTDPENNFIAINGLEGVNWEFNEEGVPVLSEKYMADLANPDKTAADALDYMVSGADTYKFLAMTSNPSPYGTYMALKDDPTASGSERDLERQSRLIGLEYDSTFFASMNSSLTDDLANARSNIDATFSTSVYEAILASSEEECVDLFEKYVSDLESMDLADLEAHWNAAYQEYISASE